jgi:nucleoside-diphosphate-sugar epimerase
MALSDEKILVTGPAGQIAFPLVRHLAADNEVWGAARFSTPESRQKVDELGVTTVVCDLAAGQFDDLPTDFTYVLHLAAYMAPGWDFDAAFRVNGEATGLLLQHCRTAKAALVMSTHSVYRPVGDPAHVFIETDPLGEVNAQHAPTYSMSKLSQEAVARFCARAFNLPVTIARMNASYGPNGGLPSMQFDAMADGNPIVTRWDPCWYSPIHEDDICTQTEALLDAASVPATIVNWAGDEPVTVQQWAKLFGDLQGCSADVQVREIPGTLRGSIASNERRLALTGPCRWGWRDGMTSAFASRVTGQ